MDDHQRELRALVDTYARAVDARDIDLFRSIWWHGARLEIHGDGPHRAPTSTLTAPDDLERVTTRLGRYHRTVHLLANHHVVVDADAEFATGEAICEAHHITLADPSAGHGAATDHVMTIRYVDLYHRANHHWRFTQRAVHLLFSTDHAVTATA